MGRSQRKLSRTSRTGFAVLALCACQSQVDHDPMPATVSGPIADDSMMTATGGTTAPAMMGSGGAPSMPVSPMDGVMMGVAGQGQAGQSDIGGSGSGGSAAADDSHDHCIHGEPADPRDAQLTDDPDEWTSASGEIDLVEPKPVLEWMGERIWEKSHDAWHNIRRCKGGGGGFGGFPGAMTTSLCMQAQLVPEHQECTDAEDGLAFLVMHRHMIHALKQAFPQHADLFAGFPHFPFDAENVPEQWRGRWGTGWSASIVDTANTLEDIENHLDQFPTEGDLGKYIQCGGMANGASSIHGAMHFKWVVNSSPYSLGSQPVNIDNYMFWKLHGWIDAIWERYRVAKGLPPDDPKLVEALTEQCREMHTLGHAVTGMTDDASTDPLPEESGVFHEMVRPILEQNCAPCHGSQSPEAGMTLGGHISSADIVKGLVGVQAMHGGQFMRVVAGDASKSWLYLKASGMAASAGCTGAACNTQVMPPTGQVTLSQTELDTIEQWIADGAAAPTSP
jgi:hypothetical protein